jgi:hypothetical protein
MREYRDGNGVAWRVWMVDPGTLTGRSSTLLSGQLRDPWLCFESSEEKRRLMPVPPSWNARSDQELDILRRAAETVPRG